jgi:hypothetical protein
MACAISQKYELGKFGARVPAECCHGELVRNVTKPSQEFIFYLIKSL